jgi:AcrR family transcriptional regulator
VAADEEAGVETDGGLDVLWGRREHPRPDPKPRLSLERIVQAAIEVADGDGLEQLSMRRVAERLGSPTMSLYRHVPGKAELLRAMHDRVLGEALEPDFSAVGWRALLTAYARQDLALHERHPWMLHLADSHHAPGPNGVTRLDTTLGALAQTALTGADKVAVVNLVAGYVQSAAGSIAGPTRTESSGETAGQSWGSSRSPFWERVKLARFPALAAVVAAGGFDGHDDPFEFGLQRVLDGIEVLVRVRGEQRSKQ